MATSKRARYRASSIGATLAFLVSRFLLREATVTHFREFLIQRSIYQLKEADPHTSTTPDGAYLGLGRARDDAKQRRLAGAVDADDSQPVA